MNKLKCLVFLIGTFFNFFFLYPVIDQKKLNKIFFKAVKNNNVSTVVQCLKNGADINFKEALLYACELDRTQLIKVLCEHGAKLNYKLPNPFRTCPLETTLLNNNKHTTCLLLMYGVKVQPLSEYELFRTRCGYSLIKYWHQNKKRFNREALKIFYQAKDFEFVRSKTFLNHLYKTKDFALIRSLFNVKCHSMVFCKNLLTIALNNKSMYLLKLILQQPHTSSMQKIIRRLLRSYKDKKNNTILHIAAQRNNFVAVKLLLYYLNGFSFEKNNEGKLPHQLTQDDLVKKLFNWYTNNTNQWLQISLQLASKLGIVDTREFVVNLVMNLKK